MATTYGAEVGIDDTQMILALLLTQFVAFPFAILSAKIAKVLSTAKVIRIYIVLYMLICLYGYGLDKAIEFWILAIAVGYIGSCIPFIIGILLILQTPFGLSTIMATRLSFILTMVWWIVFTIPLFKNVKQTHFLMKRSNTIAHSFKRLAVTFLKMKRNKRLLFFVIGYFFYIDGVYTIISIAFSHSFLYDTFV